jgi:two-component system sensor histidine kinase YesM
MQKLLQPLKRIFGDLSLMAKMTVLFLILSCFSLFACIAISNKIYWDKLQNKTNIVSQQNLDAVVNAFDVFMKNIDRLSFIVLYDEDVQSLLKNINEYNYNYTLIDKNNLINKLLDGINKQTNDIKCFYIYDNNGYKFYSKSELIDLALYDIKKASWYREVTDKNGGLIIKINGAGDLKRTFPYLAGDSAEAGFLSLIRVINDINKQQMIGISVINVEYSNVDNYLADIKKKYGLDICIWDDKGTKLTGFKGYTVSDADLDRAIREDGLQVTGQKGGKGLLKAVKSSKDNLFFGCITPLEDDFNSPKVLDTIIIIANIGFICLGALIISNLITRPINKILKGMREVGNHNFKKIGGTYGKDEIGRLKDGYNMMVSEIQELIANMVKEQELKRKYELGILLEQVKPHFLYNTFDSISSLALKKGEKEIFMLLSALGDYYKKSLSRGSEIIPLRDEIQIVRSYAYIQSYRYKDIFEMEYEIEEDILDYPVLKLILQPIVENAIYHGIRPKGEKGRILLRACKRDRYLELSVQDNGVGMSPKAAKELFHTAGPEKKSFGIKSTAERLSLYYREKDLLSINTGLEEGICVTIKIPLDT